ncbi:MAG: hypothetical protein HY814_02020 [Candidatus Riflebacteria bacterium]|nr:hypothetical protein [Candidatus Riflebacteria bacterium]
MTTCRSDWGNAEPPDFELGESRPSSAGRVARESADPVAPNARDLERTYREAARRRPEDPEPVALLGFRLLMGHGSVQEARRHFLDALRLDPGHRLANLGSVLSDFVTHGVSAASGGLDASWWPEVGDLLGQETAARVEAIAIRATKVPALERRGNDSSFFRQLGASNLSARLRLEEVRGEPRRPCVGRDEELAAVVRSMEGRGGQVSVMVAESGVDPAAVWEGAVPVLVRAWDGVHPGCTAWESRGTLGERMNGGGREAAIRFRGSCASGHVLFVRDLVESLEGARVDPARNWLASGRIVALARRDEYERLLSSAPALADCLAEVSVGGRTPEEAREALRQDRGRLETWLGAELDEEALDETVRLAARCAVGRALPESALDLMERARRRTPRAGKRVRLEVESLRLAGADWARLPVEKLAVTGSDSGSLTTLLVARVPGQEEACRAVAAAVAEHALEDRPGEPGTTAAALLFVGAENSSKSAMARALADARYGEGHFFSADLGPGLVDAESLLGAAKRGGLLTKHLARQPFSVVCLENADRAQPALLARLDQLLERGRLDGEDAGPDARRAILILGVNAPIGSTTVGFLKECRSAPGTDQTARRLFPENPRLARKLHVVPFRGPDRSGSAAPTSTGGAVSEPGDVPGQAGARAAGAGGRTCEAPRRPDGRPDA